MTMPDISLTSYAGLAAAAALLAGFWRQAYGMLHWVGNLFVCRVIIKGHAGRAVMSRVWKEGRRSPFGMRLFGGTQSFVFPKKRVEVIAFESFASEPMLLWFGRVPVLLSGRLAGNDRPEIGDYNNEEGVATLWYLRGTLAIETFIEEAVRAYNDLKQPSPTQRRFAIHRMGAPFEQLRGQMIAGKDTTPSNHHESSSDIVTRVQRNELRLLTWTPDELIERGNDEPPFSTHPVAAEVMSQFEEIGRFLRYENWFRAKGVPWRRGYLLYGPPGAGRSTLVRNLAIKHDLPIYSFDLSTYTNDSFGNDWKTAQQNTPCIALIEDIDGIFHLGENLAAKGKQRDGLTFDCLLNTISGVGTADGILLFITTNHLEALDPALGVPNEGGVSTRPGRIDRAIYMGAMGEPERRRLAQVILGDWPEIIEETVRAGEGETAAQFQDRCAQLGLSRFWKDGVKSEVAPPPERTPLITPDPEDAEDKLLRKIFDSP